MMATRTTNSTLATNRACRSPSPLSLIKQQVTLNIQMQQQETTMLSKHCSLIDTNTTEEEFKKMENAVNSLLASRIQIEQLKSERISIIQVYESKLNEQAERINYFMQENESLKAQLNENINKNANCQCCLMEHRTWRKHYETYLDNLIKQTLNELQLHESIRVEYLKLEAFLTNLKTTTNNNSFCTSNSWTFDKKHSPSNKCNELEEVNRRGVDEKNNSIDNNCQILARLNELLSQQQRRQLSLIDELSHLAFSLKINTDNNNNNNYSNRNSNNTFISKVQLNLVNGVGDRNEQNLNLNRSQLHLILNHSETSSNSNKNPYNNKSETSIAKTSLQTKAVHSSITTKPSKIPKYQRISSSNTNSATSSANDLNFSSPLTSSFKLKYLSSNSKIPQRKLTTPITAPKQTENTNLNYNTYIKSTARSLINSTTFVSKKNENRVQQVAVKDEGYSTMSNELVNKIIFDHVNRSSNNNNLSTSSNNVATMSCASTSSTSQETWPVSTSSNNSSHKHHTDSGIRISRTSGDSSSTSSDVTSSPHVTTATTTNTSSPTSSPSISSSSTNHSPRLITSIINEEIEQSLTNDTTTSTNNTNNKNITKRRREIRKRYCFPTLKSFSYYYNNRYYHQRDDDDEEKKENDKQLVEKTATMGKKIFCKYLSESDLTSLANQLSSYDKDLTYNVYHLDTLYNNVDYILFNSYASDTELVYNYNRRHGKNQHFLNSNYKLYINDYFNQPYDDNNEVEEEEEEENVDESQIQQNEFFLSKEFLCDGRILADYELDHEYEEDEKEEENYNDNNQEFESNDFNCVDVYDFNDYQYGNYYDEENDEDGEHEQIIELNVDDDEEDVGEYEDDGLLFDDDNLNDLNLLLVMKTNTNAATSVNYRKSQKHPNKKQNKIVCSSIDYENDSYEKIKIYDTNYEDYFCHVDNDENLIITTNDNNQSIVQNSNSNTTNTYSSNDQYIKDNNGDSASSSSSTSTTCSTCSKDSSLLSSFSSQISFDSINNEQKQCYIIRKIKPKISSVRLRQQQEEALKSPNRVKQRHNRLKNKKSKHHHRKHYHHRHDYFIDDEVETMNLNLDGDSAQYFELTTRNRDRKTIFDDEDEEFNEEFNIDDFVQELNFQCNIDERLQATKKAADRLKELNMMAAQALTAKLDPTNARLNHDCFGDHRQYTKNFSQTILDTNDDNDYFLFDSDQYKNEFKRPISKSLITRRHTIQSMTPRPSTLKTAATSSHQSSYISPFKEATNLDSIHYARHINLDEQLISKSLKIPSSPYKNDSKAYVGSFNQVTQSPQRRPMQITKKINNEEENINIDEFKQVNNTFNNEFYRLCSGDTFDNETSENNLNYLSQQATRNVVSFSREINNNNNYNNSKLQHVTTTTTTTISSNLTNHVNTLFDQWLTNSTNSSPCKIAVKQKTKMNQ